MPAQLTYDLQETTGSQLMPVGMSEGIEDLGLRLLRLLSPLHVHVLSLYDCAAARLWCSSGPGTADVAALVAEALDALTLEADGMQLLRALPDGRCALFLAARDSQGERRAVALAFLDGHERLELATGLGHTPRVAAVLRRLGALLAQAVDEATTPAAALPAAAAASTMQNADHGRPGQEWTAEESVAATPPGVDPGSAAGQSGLAAQTGRLRMSGELAAPLHARRYSRLRPGGSTRRYEVTLPDSNAATERQSLRRLLDFLASRRERFQREPASFLLPLSTAAILQGTFTGEAENLLLAADIAPAQVGFCVPRAAWSEHTTATMRFSDECASIGCFIALDEFNLTTAGAAAMLAAPALRCLKLDVALTAYAMGDKLAQALLAAVVQAARVLGLYCVASQVESNHLARWLASAGVEFADQPEHMGTGATSSQRRLLSLEPAHGA